MTKKISRKELLKGPDEFMTLTERAAVWVQGHTQALIYAGVAVAVLILGYLGVSWYLGYEDKKGQEVYNQAYQAMRKAEASGVEPDPSELPVDLFEEVSEEHGLARVSVLALPQVARLRFREGKVDEAIALYRRFQAENKAKEPYVTMARLAIAACYEAKEDYAAAVQELAPLEENDDAFLREQALVRLIRLHRLNGGASEAREMQEILYTEYPGSPFLPLTEALLQ